MKTILIVAAAALGLSGAAIAAETGKTVLMTDEQMDQIVAGTSHALEIWGRGNNDNNTVTLSGVNGQGPKLTSPPPGFQGHADQAAKAAE